MSVKLQLQAQWQRSREQLASNPRLSWGLWGVLLIALLYVNLVLQDNRDTQTLNLYSLQQRAAELGISNVSVTTNADQEQATDKNSNWLARLSMAEAALKEQSERFGEADSEALARADVQANINSLLVASGLKRTRIEVSAAPAPDLVTGLIPLQLKVNGQARGDQLLTLLGGLEHATPQYIITSLNVTQANRATQVSYQVLATVWYHPFEGAP